MKENSRRDTQHIVALALLAGSIVITVVVLAKVAGFYLDSAEAQNLAEKAAAQSKGDTKDIDEQVAQSKTVAADLKQKNLFAPPVKKEYPVKAVQGILGSEVLIDGKLYGVGDEINGARIVAVGSTSVTVEWEGQTKEFAPIAATAGSAPEPAGPEAPAAVQEPARTVEVPVKPVEKELVSEPVADDPFTWLDVNLPASLRDKFLEKWKALPDEKKKEAKEEWSKLSEEQKKQAVEMWKKNM